MVPTASVEKNTNQEEERVKREEKDILLRPVEAKQKQKHLHRQNRRVEERGKEEGLRWQGRPDVGEEAGEDAAELADKGEGVQTVP